MFIAIAIGMATGLSAQLVHTIGDVSSEERAYLPIDFYYTSSYSQVLYLAGEMQAGQITSIAFYYPNANSEVAPSKIWLAEVERTSFTTMDYGGTQLATDLIPLTSMTVVYEGNVVYSNGWVTIELDTPFSYTGTGSLAIAYLSNRTDYVNSPFVAFTTTDCKAVSYTVDDETIVAENISMAYGHQLRPIVQFNITPSGDFCYPVSDLHAEDITTESANIVWTADSSSTTFALEYREEGATNWTIASTNLATTSFALNNLTAFTEYEVKVYSVCDEDVSSERTFTFTTYPTADLVITAPYEQNFDDSTLVSRWYIETSGENTWYIGSGVNNTLTNNNTLTEGGALYISSDNGVTNTYNNQSESFAYAYFLTYFEEDENYGLEFDYKVGGETNGDDFAKVFVLPVGSDLPTNQLPTNGAITDNLAMQLEWSRLGEVLTGYPTGYYMIVFAWKNDDYSGTPPAMSVDNLKLFQTSCERINTFSVNYTDNDLNVDAVINVEDNNEEGIQYIVRYKSEADDFWSSITSTSPITLSDLPYSTKYQISITAVCAGDMQSVMSDITEFTTPCGAISVFPYSMSFESYVAADGDIGTRPAPYCWYNVNGGNVYSYLFSINTGQSNHAATGTGYAKFAGAGSQTTTSQFSDWLISPVFNLTGNERVNFKIRYGNTNTSSPDPLVSIYALDVTNEDISSSADTALFTLVETIRHEYTDANYYEYEVGLTSFNAATRFALVVNQVSGTFYLDDVVVSPMPACPDVFIVTPSISGATSVDLTFSTSNGVGTGWTVAYGTAESESSFNPETPETTLEVLDASELPLEITDLTPGATYYFAVKQNCDGAQWSAIRSIVIPENVHTLPYSETFTGTMQANDWTFDNTNANTAQSWVIGAAAHNPVDSIPASIDGNGLYVSADGGLTNEYIIQGQSDITAYTLVEFNDATSFTLAFDWKAGGQVSSYDGSAYDYIQAFLVPINETLNATHAVSNKLAMSTNWQRAEISLPSSYSSGLYKLAFQWYNNYSTGTQPAGAIDNISINSFDCGAVESVVATVNPIQSATDAPSVTIDYEDANEEVTYIIRYKATTDTEWVTVSGLNSDVFPYTINNLQASTQYQFEMAVDCGDGTITAFVASENVTTACAVLSTPWTEEFASSPFDGDCWERFAGQLSETGITNTSNLITTSGGWNFRNANFEATANKLYINLYSDNQYHWAITPSINLAEGTTYQIGFDLFATAFNTDGSTPPPQSGTDDKFALLVSTDNGLTWNSANGLIFAENDADTQHNFSSITNIPTRYVYRLVDQNDNPINGVVRFAFYAGSEDYDPDNNIYVDNITVEQYSPCQAPVVGNIAAADDYASVAFSDAGQATQWQYSLIEGTTTEMDNGTLVTISEEDLPLVLEDLETETTYSFAIRGICNGINTEWSNIVTFTTLATPTDIPYSTTFDDVDDNLSWAKGATTPNNWAIGSATFAGEETSGMSAYLSNDNGTSYQVTVSEEGVYAMIYRDFDFGDEEGGIFTLDFDYKISGGSGWFTDALEVHIISPDQMPISGDYLSNPTASFSNKEEWEHASIEMTGITGIKRVIFLAFGYLQYEADRVPAAIDNVSLAQVTCPRPYDVEISDITTTSATIAWEGSAEEYVISYRPISSTTATEVTATSSPFVLTDLVGSATYAITIQSNCGDELSLPSDELQFRTNCLETAINTFPWTEGF